MSTISTPVFQSRWGYHPVSYADFRKLKELRKRYFQTLRDVARFRRWDRKTVYRVGPQPSFREEMVTRRWGQLYANDHGVLEAFEIARRPAATPEEVRPLPISMELVEKLLSEV